MPDGNMLVRLKPPNKNIHSDRERCFSHIDKKKGVDRNGNPAKRTPGENSISKKKTKTKSAGNGTNDDDRNTLSVRLFDAVYDTRFPRG